MGEEGNQPAAFFQPAEILAAEGTPPLLRPLLNYNKGLTKIDMVFENIVN